MDNLEKKQNFNSSFSGHEKEIGESNFSTLKLILVIFTLVFGAILVVSNIVPDYFALRGSFSIVFLTGIACLFLVYKKTPKPENAVYLLYFAFSVAFIYTIYASIIVSPSFRATNLLYILVVTPLLILDKAWRVNLFTFAYYSLHSVFSFVYKANNLAIDDFLNSTICLILGILIGDMFRKTKIKNFELHKKTQDLAELDFLTGLYNRRKMYEMIIDSEAGIKVVKGIILFDIDFFKGYNDNYGHMTGDKCLRSLGDFMKKFGQEHGLEFFRYGGEEFIAFDYTRNSEELGKISETLRQAVLDLKIPYPDYAVGYLTVSCGYGNVSNNSVEQSISCADEALYQAKEQGRNRSVGC